MKKRSSLHVIMELLSDTIFGSGYSVPGGEDIAVCKDSMGYPFLKGSTFKGLLRESLENWLVWTSGDVADLNALLGESDWSAPTSERRLHLTQLCLLNPPEDAESCYTNRTFTSLKDGVVKHGTLRTTACLCTGLRFHGFIECTEDDTVLIGHALSGIKWVGTMRSRGFGHVRITCEKALTRQSLPEILTAGCIRYRLLTQSPVLITDLSRSRGNELDSRPFIPGSAIRGMVASTLAESYPEIFAAIRPALLGCGTRFLDAVPVRGNHTALPALMGYYENKSETEFKSILKDSAISNLKRAKIGSFCSLDGDTLHFWNPVMSGSTRIAMNHERSDHTGMFQTRYMEAGELLEGYILLDEPSLAAHICQAFEGTVWLGADRYSGFGKCSVEEIAAQDEADWITAYGFHKQEEIGTELYMLAVSPFTMLDESGEPCGIDEKLLAKELDVSSVDIILCATGISEYGGYNRAWKSRNPAARMYDRGSLFHLHCDKPPRLERLRKLEYHGLGIRRSEGFGQVLFLPWQLLDKIQRKEAVNTRRPEQEALLAAKRRDKLVWIMDHAGEINCAGISASQLGTLQELGEKARHKSGDLTEIIVWLEKNLSGRGEEHGARFKRINSFLEKLLDKDSVLDGLGTPTISERLELLCMLCDYSRKVR